MNDLIKASNIHWSIKDAAILRNISLNLKAGEILGIIGPNGAGKSSLLKILARITEADTGELELNGQAYRDVELRSFARQLAYLEQTAPVNWPLLVEKVIQLGRSPYQNAYARLGKADEGAINKAIQATGIEHLRERVISTLSQGEKMLVALSRILASEPKVILADEPIAALDPYHQLLIMELIQAQTRAEQQGLTQGAIVILHDLSLAVRFCDRLVLLHEGKVVSSGDPESVLSRQNLREFYKINCYSDFKQALIQPLSRI